MNLKKHLAAMFLALVFLFGQNSATAAIADVDENHWASEEIQRCVENNFLKLDANQKFNPESTITRADFVIALLKVLRSEDVKVVEKNQFKDVKTSTKGKVGIITSQQLKIIFGYPDKTFKPEVATKRSEAMSVIANISKKFPQDNSILEQFEDYKTIPGWAVSSWAKNVKNDFYVNYPAQNMLRPEDNLTRAEAAVLLNKVSTNLALIESRYKNSKKIDEIYLGSEILEVYAGAPRKNVDIYNIKTSVEAGNVFIAKFEQDFNSKAKYLQANDKIDFNVPYDVVTNAGTMLLPSGTRLSAEVLKIKPSKWKSVNDKALVVLDTIVLPNGRTLDMAGVPLTEKGKLVKVSDKPEKTNAKEMSRAAFLIQYAGKIAPIIKYDNKNGDEIYILLTGDMIIKEGDL